MTTMRLDALAVGDDEDGEEADEARQEHRIEEDDEAGSEEILELGGFDFAIDLGERFLAAHGQQRMAEGDENAESADDSGESFEPALEDSFPVPGTAESVKTGWSGGSVQGNVLQENGEHAPADDDHAHDGGELHDAQGFVAGFVHADDVRPPEIKGDADGQHAR